MRLAYRDPFPFSIDISHDVVWASTLPDKVTVDATGLAFAVEKTVDGLNEDKFQTEIVTVGVNFFPVDQAVIKMDYSMKKVNNVDKEDILSLSIGFIF